MLHMESDSIDIIKQITMEETVGVDDISEVVTRLKLRDPTPNAAFRLEIAESEDNKFIPDGVRDPLSTQPHFKSLLHTSILFIERFGNTPKLIQELYKFAIPVEVDNSRKRLRELKAALMFQAAMRSVTRIFEILADSEVPSINTVIMNVHGDNYERFGVLVSEYGNSKIFHGGTFFYALERSEFGPIPIRNSNFYGYDYDLYLFPRGTNIFKPIVTGTIDHGIDNILLEFMHKYRYETLYEKWLERDEARALINWYR